MLVKIAVAVVISTLFGSVSLSIASVPAKVSLGELVGNDSTGYTLPIIVDDMSTVIAGQLEIGPVGDGASITATKLMDGYLVETNQVTQNLLASFAGVDPPKEGGAIFLVKFEKKPTYDFSIKSLINEDPAILLLWSPARAPQSTNIKQMCWGQIKAHFVN